MLSHGEEQVARYYDEQIYEAEIARLPREFPVEMRITKRFLAKWIQPGMTVAEAGWCRQVQGFGQGNETGPRVVQFLESCQQVRHGSAPTLQAPHQHHVDFAATRRIQQPSRSCR
jgi:hypothetical protein